VVVLVLCAGAGAGAAAAAAVDQSGLLLCYHSYCRQQKR